MPSIVERRAVFLHDIRHPMPSNQICYGDTSSRIILNARGFLRITNFELLNTVVIFYGLRSLFFSPYSSLRISLLLVEPLIYVPFRDPQ